MKRPGAVLGQRLRVRFGRGEEMVFISHLDLMRFWERAIRRASLPLEYSQGFTPHPRISIASPMALGVTGEAELMDIHLSRWVAPHLFIQALRRQLPAGVTVHEASTIPASVPSLQSQVRLAEYRADMEREGAPEDVPGIIERFLAAKNFMWQHKRDTGVRSYDLRALVNGLWLVEESADTTSLGMMLRCDPGGAGRPEQVTAALGFPRPPLRIHRVRLVLEAPARSDKRTNA